MGYGFYELVIQGGDEAVRSAGHLTGTYFSVKSASKYIALGIIDNGIIHGIDTCDHRETRVTTGFLRFIYNRVGVTGTGW